MSSDVRRVDLFTEGLQVFTETLWVISICEEVDVRSFAVVAAGESEQMKNELSGAIKLNHFTVTSQTRQDFVRGSRVIRGRRLAEHRVTDGFDSRSDPAAGQEKVT